MKFLATLTIAAACAAGLSGCVTPTHTYDQIHSRDWTRESFETRFPNGTSEKQVFNKLGGPYAFKDVGELTRWDFVGGPSGQQHVTMIFRNGILIQKQYENF